MNPKAMALIERAKAAIARHADDPRTPELVEQARAVLHHAQPWQDVTAIREYTAA